jgi:prevent-host-death family protein
MRTFSAADAKNHFGELLDAARREPVSIEKHGRPVAVMISQEDYELAESMKLGVLREKIARAEADVATGRTVTGEDAFRQARDVIARGGR